MIAALLVLAALACLGLSAALVHRIARGPSEPPASSFQPRATILDGRTGDVLEVLTWPTAEAVSVVEIGHVLAWHRKRGRLPRIVLERREGDPEILDRKDRRIAEAAARRVNP
jgi:hypothetical protein